MSSISEYFSGLFGGIKSLLTGMGVTWKELWTEKITEQYPENRATLVIPDRFRGELVMPHDKNNEHACTACGICQINCPNGTIKVQSLTVETEDGKKKKVLDKHIYDLGMCTFCNLCVITCPQDAIVFTNEFENAIFTRSKLIQKLNKEGSKLREKPPVAKPKAETPATEEKPVTRPVSKPVVEEKVVAKASVEAKVAEVKPKVAKPKTEPIKAEKAEKAEAPIEKKTVVKPTAKPTTSEKEKVKDSPAKDIEEDKE